jgi:hypothetical protein
MNEILKDFRHLSPPPKQLLDEHAIKVAKLIEQMGDKYRLSTPMPRKQ